MRTYTDVSGQEFTFIDTWPQDAEGPPIQLVPLKPGPDVIHGTIVPTFTVYHSDLGAEKLSGDLAKKAAAVMKELPDAGKEIFTMGLILGARASR